MASELSLGFDDIRADMRKLKPKTVLLQLPSGLKRKAEGIARAVEKEYGCQVIISGDPCFGACDITKWESDAADVIIQVGHSPMPSIRCPKPILFMPVGISFNLRKLVSSATPLLTSPVGLLATSQHIGQLEESKKILEDEGFKVKIGKGSGRLAVAGLVLGCDYSSAHDISKSVSSFLVIGGGSFHAIGLKLSTGKPVVIVDPERSKAHAEEVDIDSFKRRRHAVITSMSDAGSIGIIVSSKLGQERMALARRLLKDLRGAGRRGHIVLMDNVTPEALQDIGFDAYVSTACPRIAIDDFERFGRPIATPMELIIALGKADWNDYKMDEWGG
jgi:2-(3-amino-3-carboxypropyl)histidine synthase